MAQGYTDWMALYDLIRSNKTMETDTSTLVGSNAAMQTDTSSIASSSSTTSSNTGTTATNTGNIATDTGDIAGTNLEMRDREYSLYEYDPTYKEFSGTVNQFNDLLNYAQGFKFVIRSITHSETAALTNFGVARFAGAVNLSTEILTFGGGGADIRNYATAANVTLISNAMIRVLYKKLGSSNLDSSMLSVGGSNISYASLANMVDNNMGTNGSIYSSAAGTVDGYVRITRNFSEGEVFWIKREFYGNESSGSWIAFDIRDSNGTTLHHEQLETGGGSTYTLKHGAEVVSIRLYTDATYLDMRLRGYTGSTGRYLDIYEMDVITNAEQT